MAVGKRVAEIRASLSLSQQEFSELISVSRSYIGDIESGRKEPSFNFLQSLIATLKISLDWMMTGEGNMYRQPAADISKTKTLEEIDESLKQLSDEQRQEIFSSTLKMLKMNALEKEMKEMKEVLKQLKPKVE